MVRNHATRSRRTSNAIDGNGQVLGPWGGRSAAVFGNVGRNRFLGQASLSGICRSSRHFRSLKKFKAQFRAESFNFANHVNLANPNACVDCPGTAGTITNIFQLATMRQWQFGLRLPVLTGGEGRVAHAAAVCMRTPPNTLTCRSSLQPRRLVGPTPARRQPWPRSSAAIRRRTSAKVASATRVSARQFAQAPLVPASGFSQCSPTSMDIPPTRPTPGPGASAAGGRRATRAPPSAHPPRRWPSAAPAGWFAALIRAERIRTMWPRWLSPGTPSGLDQGPERKLPWSGLVPSVTVDAGPQGVGGLKPRVRWSVTRPRDRPTSPRRGPSRPTSDAMLAAGSPCSSPVWLQSSHFCGT